MTAASPLALLLFLQAPPEAPPPEVVREIAVMGASVYERADVVRIIRQAEGQELRARPEALAARLESRYHLDGYLAASVSAAFEAGRLQLTVDEGPLAEVRVEGVDGASARRAVRAAELVPGRVLEQGQVWDAFARIERASDGALKPDGDPPYAVERTPEGALLVLRLRRIPVKATIWPAGPRAAGRYNRVDGLSLSLLGELTLHDTRTYDHFRLWALGAWGFSADKLRYALGVARSLGGQKVALGYEYHDLTDTDDTWHKRGLEEGTGGIINTQSTSDYFRRTGHLVFAFAHPRGPGLELGAFFRFDHYTSLPVTTDDSLIGYKEPRPNPHIEEGRMRSLVLVAGWVSKGALFPTPTARRQSFLQRNLFQLGVTKPEGVRVEATLEMARTGFGSDYDFTRLIGNVRTHHELGPRFLLDTRLVAGSTTGDPPSFRRFYVGGVGTLRGYEPKQFDGTEMALYTAEIAFLPGFRLPAIIPFYEGGRTWGAGVNPAAKWRSALGLSLRWPARETAFFVRGEAVWPLDPQPGQDKSTQFYARIGIPF